jgi:hypothetical protein
MTHRRRRNRCYDPLSVCQPPQHRLCSSYMGAAGRRTRRPMFYCEPARNLFSGILSQPYNKINQDSEAMQLADFAVWNSDSKTLSSTAIFSVLFHLIVIIPRIIIYDSVLKSMTEIVPFLLRIRRDVRELIREGAERENRSQNNYVASLILKDRNRKVPPNDQPDEEIDIAFE